MSVENTLKERGARYGSFAEHAKIAQGIQDAYRVIPARWDKLPPVLKQGLTTIADKIARMLNGDHMYEDNVHDIIGYAKLMEDWIKLEKSIPVVTTGKFRDTILATVSTEPYTYNSNDKI